MPVLAEVNFLVAFAPQHIGMIEVVKDFWRVKTRLFSREGKMEGRFLAEKRNGPRVEKLRTATHVRVEIDLMWALNYRPH